jgi:glucose/arabinose dehydrogenase
MISSRRKLDHRRRASPPQFEALEPRSTPTTLPTGFTEATVATGLSRPTAMEFAPDGRLFVLEQAGNVELVRSDGTTWTALHLDVDSQGERGLLGIAFDPAFASNHYVYLYYTNPNPGAAPWATGEHNQLSRFTVEDSDPAHPIFTDEAPILDWNTLSAATNHNGGAIHFGLDGMLYADAGDNVQTFTQGGNTYRVSQTLSDLLGKQLRIDVGAFNQGIATRDDTTVGHLIPADNPFVGTAPGINQLIYALGLRNPFSFAVQPGTGKIFVNDVGENVWEEIDQIVAGGNYGWSGGETDGFGQSPPGPGVYHDPLLAYNHVGGPAGGGTAIVGGTFYDPPTPQFPASYVGKYFYADLSGGWIRVFDPANPGRASDPDTSSPFASGIAGGLIDLKVDLAGNLYYLTESGSVEEVSYRAPAVNVGPTPVLAPGLDAEFFDFRARLRALPSLAGRVADVTRIDPLIDYRRTGRPWPGLDARFAGTFAVRETGLLEISTPGRYKLTLRSQDGSRLWLDGSLLVNDGGIHPMRRRAGSLTLAAGLHTLRVESFASARAAGLILSWSGPGIPEQVVPADHLFHPSGPTGT